MTLVVLCLFCVDVVAQDKSTHRDIFAKDNLVAWCIVPFDAVKRGPAERAEMVRRLGLSKVAYDWRRQHVAEFEEEILQYKKHGIEYFAFWSWHDSMTPLIRKYGIRPQVWQTCRTKNEGTQVDKIQDAANALLPLVQTTRDLGLKLGLYNHGGWGGEPQNLVAVCQYLRQEHEAAHVGIVYNLHHGHEHVDDFAGALDLMMPYLLCLNLNGMADPKQAGFTKILPIGEGVYEKSMIRTIAESSYRGPIGVLGHRADVDAEIAVKQNLDGLTKLLGELQR